MAIPILVPRLGWNMEEGVFAGWLLEDGATVRAGTALFSLESDKAKQDVESLDDGILRISPDAPREGQTVAVGAVLGYLVSPGEALPAHECDKPTANVVAAVAASAPAVRPTPADRPRSTPRARRIARELGIDWTTLRGSGRTGRIRERDVRTASSGPPVPVERVIDVTPMRRKIAERMLASQRATAPVTLTTTADATNLVNLRNQFQAAVQAGSDLVPSYTDFLVKLTARALEKHPLLNARWHEERIIVPAGIHIGVAVDTETGLLVPVLRDVPALGLKQLTLRMRDLIERARQRQLAANDLQGGTFTVTNLGAFGVDTFTPIIHHPQCAILGIGRIQRRPVTLGEQIVAREQVSLSLTFDHRLVDGAPAARFLQTLTALIENPGPWLLP